MDHIWHAAPSPAIRLGEGVHPLGWRVNAAAQQWAEARGLSAQTWPDVAIELRARLLHGAQHGRLPALTLDWTAVTLGAADWLVWMSPAAPVTNVAAPIPWRSAEDQLALVQELVKIGVFERDLRTLEARWDATMFELFGLDPAQGAPRFDRAAEVVHPEDRAQFWADHHRLIRNAGRHSMRYRIVWPDGSVHDLHSLVDVRHDATGRPLTMVGVVIDDSEGATRVRAQVAARTDLERALHLAKVSVWQVDYGMRRIAFNDVGYELIDRPPQPGGIDLDELRSWAHPDDVPDLLEAADLAAATGEVVDVDLRFRLPDGRYRPLLTRRVAERNERGEVVGLLGISIDQSAQTAERLRAQALSRRIELVADAAALGIWSVDDADGRVEWNAQMFRIYGIGPDRLPPTLAAWRDALVHPDDRVALTLARQQSLDSGARGFETEFRILRPDGTVRWVTSRSRREQHDGRTMLIGIHLDTTELIMQRQRAEQALRASRAKSEFLARASHELRTPLNAVLGFAQLIEHDGLSAPPEVQLRRAVRIRSAGEHLLALVDDVLDLAAIEAGSLVVEMLPVSIDAVLADVAQWLESLAQRLGVTVDVCRCGGWVRADARRLRQIVANLLSNAVKFNRRGGHVWLHAERQQDDGAAPVWQIAVRDDGRGLSAAQQAHLFEAFHRLGAEREGIDGVGLGLTIVRQLTDLMGGSIVVDSALGRGSEFRVGLPASDPERSPNAPRPVAGRAPVVGLAATSALRLLYIEDNPVNVVLVESLVALRAGVCLRCAVDGLSGVALAIAQPPHLMLIDMQLPDIDGFEVLSRLRKEPALDETRMIALSANGLTEDIERALAAGFDDYWTKPIDLKQFLARLDELIADVSA